jgi:hypothetical protein
VILSACMACTVHASGDPAVGIGTIITASAATAANGVVGAVAPTTALGLARSITATTRARGEKL